MKFIKKITIGILVLSIVVVISACSQSDEDKTGTNGNTYTLSISGSTSVGPLAEKLADKYVENKGYKNRDKSNWFFCWYNKCNKWCVRNWYVFA